MMGVVEGECGGPFSNHLDVSLIFMIYVTYIINYADVMQSKLIVNLFLFYFQN